MGPFWNDLRIFKTPGYELGSMLEFGAVNRKIGDLAEHLKPQNKAMFGNLLGSKFYEQTPIVCG